MTNETITTYETKYSELCAIVSSMHETSNWTSEMIQTEDKLNSKIVWLQKRISNINDMIEDKDAYHNAYLKSQY